MTSPVSAPSNPALDDAFSQILVDVIEPSALQVDREGSFPTHNIQALSRAGLLGLLSATDVGGAGLGLRVAADVIERLSATCGSTAMILLMHYAAVQLL